MKKFLALLIAIIIGIIGNINIAQAGQLDIPQDTKSITWEIGYHARCRTIGKGTRIRINSKRMTRVILLPLMLFAGTAGKTTSQQKVWQVKVMHRTGLKKQSFATFKEAKEAYVRMMNLDKNMPRVMYNTSAGIPVMVAESNWDEECQNKENIQNWKEKARQLLKSKRLTTPQIDALLSAIESKELQNIVASNNIERLCEIPGIAEKSAYKIVAALRPISLATKTLRSYKSTEFTRLTLHHMFGHDDYYVVDTIRKGITPIEAKALSLGGDDAVIHVVSKVPEPKSNEDYAAVEELMDFWRDATHNGIVINGIKYVFLGHGTNAAKGCKSVWVKETIYDKMRTYMLKGTNLKWSTTAAKKIAYLCGLQLVTRNSVRIPFEPEDFAFFPSVFSDINGDMDKEYLDGSEAHIDNNTESVNRSDGYFIINIPDSMVKTYVERLVQRGKDYAEAEEIVEAFRNDHSINSYRVNGAAIKGCGDKHIDAHHFLYSRGINKTPDGRDIHYISVFCDETVLKTSIGPNGAYPTFEAWCNAVRDEFDLGICVKAHKKDKKDVSYQVIQSLCEATGATVRKMAKSTIDKCNAVHTVEGASRLIGRERGHIMRIFPELANVRNIREMLDTRIQERINDAFGGKLIDESYYFFITPDPFYVLEGWFGLEKKGCLEAGQAHVSGVKYGKMAFWRSPVMHPNSVRIYQNVPVKKDYRKFIKSEQCVIMMNSIDDVSLAVAADWDGDHGSVSEFEPLIEAIEETLRIWNRLVIWETPTVPKQAISREMELDYIEGLTKENELGLTVYGLNALLNRILKVKDPITKKIIKKVIKVTHRGVNYKVFAGNVLVDAGKHGGAELNEPEESSQSKDMEQPWAKTYRDAVENKYFWKVTINDGERTSYRFFETKGEAEAEAESNPFACAPVNYLDELASLKNKQREHMAGTLNKLFALYSTYIDRSHTIYDLPDKQFDFHNLMYNTEEKYRGMSGLFRIGAKTGVTDIDGMTMRPDEGLFNIIARRFERDRRDYQNDDTRKDLEDTSFEEIWRINALAEIQAYAEAFGRTLEDAYDLVTWQMFKFVDDQCATQDGKLDYVRDNLWRAYWLIFGGMAEEAAMRFEQDDD